MSEFALQAEQESNDGFFTSHLISLAVAFFFLVFGVEKLAGTQDWVMVFNRIGLGTWFRYFTGCVQISGALLLVLRRTALIGAFLLACTMIGAMVVQFVVAHKPADAAFPGMFLLAILLAAAVEIHERRAR